MRSLLADLSPNTKYVVQVRTVSSSAVSEWSRKFEFTTTIDSLAPERPSNLAIGMTGATANLTWAPVTINEDGSPCVDLMGYEITIRSQSVPAKQFVTRVGNVSNYDFTYDQNRRTFGTPKFDLYYEIVAFDTVENMSAMAVSSTLSIEPLDPPSNLTAISVSDGIALDWTGVTHSVLSGYRVYQGTTPSAQVTKVFESSPTSYVFPSTMYGQDQYFKVTAFDMFGRESDPSNVAGPVRPKSPFALDTVGPATPTGLSVTLTNSPDGKSASATASWTAVPDPDNDLDVYVVSYKRSTDSAWQYVTVNRDSTSVKIEPIVPFVNYNFRIMAKDFTSNPSSWSPIVTKTAVANTAPATTTGVAAVAGRDSITVSWTAGTEPDVVNGLGTYLVDIATNTSFTAGLLSYRTGATNITVSGLQQDQTYYARVKTVDSAGMASASWSATVSAKTGVFPTTPLSDGNPPASSPTPTATGGAGYVWLSWPASTNVDPVTYEVHVGTASNFTTSSSTKIAEATGTTIVVENDPTGSPLVDGTNYYFKTVAKDRDGSAPSSAASAAAQVIKTVTESFVTGYVDPKVATLVKNSVVEYSVNSSEATAPTSGWSTSTPTRTPGSFVWYRTVVTYGNNTTSTSSPALLTGNTGSPGASGAPAAYISLTATTQVLTSPSTGGATTPSTSTVTGTATNTTITAWTYSVDNGAFSATVPAGVSRTNNVVTITGSSMTAKTITVKMADANGVSDTLTVARVFDGAAGANGSTGPAGADAYTVVLSNEAHTFAGSTSAAIAGSTTSKVIAYKGATQMPATVGTITGQVTGLTTSISGNGTTAPVITVSATTSLTTRNGTLTVPVTVDGKTFTKTIAWSLALTGAPGSQGIQGPAGDDGQTFYTWIKYADTPTSGMDDSPTGKTYMGIAYNKTTQTESSNYADYEWSLIKGADGIQGPAGANGQPTYTWIKYATSSAGAGMSDDPTGKTYMGIAYNKATATESSTASDYEWSLIQGPQGPAGANAESISLTATTQVLTSPATGGATTPATAVVTGSAFNTSIYIWTYSVNGAAFSATTPAGVTRSGNVVTITGSTMTAKTITVRAWNDVDISDTLTVAKVSDGAQGTTGATGSTGAAGADAYTVLLSNEAHTFPGSTTAALAGSTTSTVIAYKGATKVAATVGTITGQVTGLTTSVASNGTTAPVITVTAATTLTTRNGTLTVPVTVDGKSFTKTIAWAVAYQGSAGSPGATGPQGVSVSSVTPYFQKVTTGSTPAIPTVSPPPSPWTTTEPDYSVNTELFRTDRIVYSNSTFSYTPVTKVSSYAAIPGVLSAAALTAQEKADLAEARTISRGTDLVTNGTGYLKSNYNFPGFTFDGSDSPVGTTGSFVDNHTAQHSEVISELIPYDPAKSYRFSFQARQTVPGATNRMYGFIATYDADGLAIAPYFYMYQPGTTTTLAQELKSGDTTVVLTSAANWYKGVTTHLRSIVYWDYTDGNGKIWPKETYSRSWSGADTYSTTGITGNTITLNAPYSGPTRPAGTWVSNGSSGGSYIYTPSASNVVVPETWTMFADVLKPLSESAPRGPASSATWSTGVPPMTAAIKIGWLTNYPAVPANPIVGRHAIAAVSFSDASAANYAANNITETQITDGAISTPKIQTNAIDARTIKADAIESGHIKAGAIIAGKLAADSVLASNIKANEINATHMAIGDMSNMAHINESIPGMANFAGQGHIITNGWSTRAVNTGIYFMFRDQAGPLPFRTGDRIRLTFDAYADASVTANADLWVYGNTNLSQRFGPVALKTTVESFDLEMTVTADTNLKTSFLIGLIGVAGRNVFVRNVRAYRMNAGELIVDGTITGNKMVTNSMDANVIKTSTLTSTTITLGTGGVIKTSTGGVSITDSGIIIPQGALDANILKANTSFVNTLNIGAGGSIQSTGYTSGGTSGFSLSNTGLTIKGSGNVVDAGVIKGGTISGTTINVGAGGTLNIDSTAQVKSNNYAANSTGYRLSNTGLEINDGSIDAKALRANSAIINEITIGATNTGPGAIRSKDYVAGSAGFKLSTAGLEINKGSISAEALRINSGVNLLPLVYSDFESVTTEEYSAISGHFFVLREISNTEKRFGTQCLKLQWTGGAGALHSMSTGEPNYNIEFDPTKPLIASAYLKGSATQSIQLGFRFETSSGPSDLWSPTLSVGTTWARTSAAITPPANSTGRAYLHIKLVSASQSQTLYVDGVQVEERTGATNDPSPWKPPSFTTIDGGQITTGVIKSNSVNSNNEPYWSINKDGNARFARALVVEELLVGDPGDTSKKSVVQSINFIRGSKGWQMDSNGRLEANDGVFRGNLGFGIVASNFVPDGSFEGETEIANFSFADPPDGWTQWPDFWGKGFVTKNYGFARSGGRCAKMVATKDGGGSLHSSSFHVTPGTKYEVTFAVAGGQSDMVRLNAYMYLYATTSEAIDRADSGIVEPDEDSIKYTRFDQNGNVIDTGEPPDPVSANAPNNIPANGVGGAIPQAVDPDKITPNDYVIYSASYTIPAGKTNAFIRIINRTDLDGLGTQGTLYVDDVSCIDIENGRGGAEISSAGIRLFGEEGNEVAAFVHNRPSYLQIIGKDEKGSPQTFAQIDQTGSAYFSNLSVQGSDMVINGRPLIGKYSDYEPPLAEDAPDSSLFDTLARGILAFGNTGTGDKIYGSKTQIYMWAITTSFVAEAGRSYIISFNGVTVRPSQTTSPVGVKVTATWANPTTGEADVPTFSSSSMIDARIAPVSTSRDDFIPAAQKVLSVTYDGLTGTHGIRAGEVKLTLWVVTGAANATLNVRDRMQLVVEDIGIRADEGRSDVNTSINTTGSSSADPPPPPAKVKRTKTYTMTSSKSWYGSGGVRGTNTEVVQGYYPGNGNQKGLFFFPSWTGDLSGATVNKVEVYVYATHWYNSSGGTAAIKLHGSSSPPPSFPSVTTAINVSSWQKGEGKWVTLPSSTYAGFKSGTYRGFGVGPAPTNSYTYYGRFEGRTASAAGSKVAKVRITYTK